MYALAQGIDPVKANYCIHCLIITFIAFKHTQSGEKCCNDASCMHGNPLPACYIECTGKLTVFVVTLIMMTVWHILCT